MSCSDRVAQVPGEVLDQLKLHDWLNSHEGERAKKPKRPDRHGGLRFCPVIEVIQKGDALCFVDSLPACRCDCCLDKGTGKSGILEQLR